jgi:hypothetical protein
MTTHEANMLFNFVVSLLKNFEGAKLECIFRLNIQALLLCNQMAYNAKQVVFERNIHALFYFVTQQENFSAEKLIEFLQTEKAENFVDLSRFALLAKFYEQDK